MAIFKAEDIYENYKRDTHEPMEIIEGKPYFNFYGSNVPQNTNGPYQYSAEQLQKKIERDGYYKMPAAPIVEDPTRTAMYTIGVDEVSEESTQGGYITKSYLIKGINTVNEEPIEVKNLTKEEYKQKEHELIMKEWEMLVEDYG